MKVPRVVRMGDVSCCHGDHKSSYDLSCAVLNDAIPVLFFYNDKNTQVLQATYNKLLASHRPTPVCGGVSLV